MTHSILEEFAHVLRRQINTTSDPRVGSARDNGTTVSVLATPTGGTNSASFSTFFMTLVPVTVYAVVCVIIFVVLRRLCPRVYTPRTFLTSLHPHERSKELPKGWFNWFMPFWRTPDEDVLNHSSLDGYLFLRFLKVLIVICCVGLTLIWPILLPLHSYGGGGTTQLDSITFGNITKPSWCYAHALIAWVYFGFILYMVSRECVYFINLRQAYLLAPHYADRLSSRTVLFTCVTQNVLDERKLRRVFGDSVKNIWIPRDTADLDELVKEREQTANRLERAEMLLIKKANLAYQKFAKSGHPDVAPMTQASSFSETKEINGNGDVNVTEVAGTPTSPQSFARSDGTPIMATSYGLSGPSFDINGSIAAQWIGAEERPYHRPIANYGRRVDTIKWTRKRLKEIGTKISKLRRDYRKGKGGAHPAVFIEFHTQVDAQAAYQTLAHHRANHMRSEIVGVRPEEIVWESLYFKWWERIIRRFLIQGFVAVMVIFWSIPAAVVGSISNVKTLASDIFFLSWLAKLPSFIIGLISGLLPAVALACLMSIVPMIMRACARQSGVATESRIELFVQNAYFVFQIVQVFLVTTLTSAASAAIASVIQNPLSIRELLSKNLPKASNFYISYFLLQGFAMSATRIVHLGGIFRHQLMSHSGGNPRRITARYHRLRKIHWGSVYPVFTSMGVIAITYSIIAPVVLGVAALGLFFIYLTFRYNLLYVYSSERDTRGLHYPRALRQVLTGVYLAEICLVGLFGLKGAYGPVVLTFGLIIFSALIHVSLDDALGPLMFNLPRTLAAEEELRKAGNHPWNAAQLEDWKDVAADAQMDAEQNNAGYDSDFDPSDPTDANISHGEQNTRSVSIPIEGADQAFNLGATTLSGLMRAKIQKSPLPTFIDKIDFWSYWITPDLNARTNFITKPILKFLHPEVFADYHMLRDKIPQELREIQVTYDDGVLKDAYSPPSVRTKSPRLWIPRDKAGVSRQEVAHSSKVVEMSDEGAWVDEKGRLTVELEGETERWVLRDWERVRF